MTRGRKPPQFVGATHATSEPERAALGHLEEWGLVDVFRRLYDDEGLYTWWDDRAGSFHKHEGLRIDLILVTESLARGTTYGLIDRNACGRGRRALVGYRFRLSAVESWWAIVLALG